MPNRPHARFRGRHSAHQSQHGHKRGRYEHDEGPQVYGAPSMDEDGKYRLNQRLERALEREAEAFARQRAAEERIKIAKAALSTFGITDFGPNLSNLDLTEVARACKAETTRQNEERKQARLETAAAAHTEDQTVKMKVTETNSTKGDRAHARGSDSVALEAQATVVANADDETVEKEKNAQGHDSGSISGTHQDSRDGQRDQAIRAEFDELLSPLMQSLGEALNS